MQSEHYSRVEGICPFYRASRNVVLSPEATKPIMDWVLRYRCSGNHAKELLYRFIVWAVDNGKITPPAVPEIPDNIHEYYQLLYNSLQRSLEEYRALFHDLIVEYNPALENRHVFQLHQAPSNTWMDVMTPTSIAMGQIQVGHPRSFGKLSPQGAIWRADTVRGLVDSLQNAMSHKYFATYCVFDTEALPQYFLECHHLAYMGAANKFTKLTLSDVSLIFRAAMTSLDGKALEIMKRGAILLIECLKHPAPEEWIRNLMEEGKSALRYLRGVKDELPYWCSGEIHAVIDGKKPYPESRIAQPIGRMERPGMERPTGCAGMVLR
jgi:hypothetical protein